MKILTLTLFTIFSIQSLAATSPQRLPGYGPTKKIGSATEAASGMVYDCPSGYVCMDRKPPVSVESFDNAQMHLRTITGPGYQEKSKSTTIDL